MNSWSLEIFDDTTDDDSVDDPINSPKEEPTSLISSMDPIKLAEPTEDLMVDPTETTAVARPFETGR